MTKRVKVNPAKMEDTSPERVKIETNRKLTKSAIDRLPGPSGRETAVRFYDTEMMGFGISVGKKSKTFFVERMIKGRGYSRRKSIGKYGEMTLDQARVRASEFLDKMFRGIDPVEEEEARQEEEEKKRVEQKGWVTLQQLWDEFKAAKKESLRASTLKNYGRYITGELKDWLDRRVRDITGEDVRKRHQVIGSKLAKRGRVKKSEDGKPLPRKAYSNIVMRALQSVLQFAVDRERPYIKTNPVHELGRLNLWHGVEPRESVIRTPQLSAFYRGLEGVRTSGRPLASMVCDYLELLLLTGLRREEGLGLRWTEIDFEQKLLTLPALRTKKNRKHQLPLTDHLITILERRKIEAGESQFVFPSQKFPGKLVNSRRVKDEVEKASGITFLCHDLRRTFASVAHNEVGIGYLTVQRLLNHKASGVTPEYIVKDTEHLREPMQKITDFFLSHKAKAQGMKLAQ